MRNRKRACKNDMPKIKMPSSVRFIDGFEDFITEKKAEGCRDATIKHYKDCIHVFTLYLDSDSKMDEITKDTITGYHEWLINRGISDVTIRTHMRAVRTLFYWLFQNDYLEEFTIHASTSGSYSKSYIH